MDTLTTKINVQYFLITLFFGFQYLPHMNPFGINQTMIQEKDHQYSRLQVLQKASFFKQSHTIKHIKGFSPWIDLTCLFMIIFRVRISSIVQAFS